jgi:hypothetical protein
MVYVLESRAVPDTARSETVLAAAVPGLKETFTMAESPASTVDVDAGAEQLVAPPAHVAVSV